MFPVHTAHQIRQAEEAFFAAHPDQDLMQRAADAISETAQQMVQGTDHRERVLVAVGGGNNGGDGLFAAARLAGIGCQVSFWLVGEQAHPAGLAAARDAGCHEVDAVAAVQELAEADLLVDAVLGIGGRAGLPAPVATLAAEAQALGVPVLAVDVPSGLASDAGAADEESFHATRTITFASRKPCHVMQPAAGRCGEVEVADIGLDLPQPSLRQLEPADVAQRWPWPDAKSDKYSRGVVGIDTGSQQYQGAAILGTTGAVHAGAGMTRFVGPDAVGERIRTLLPSVTHGEGKVQAWLVGSGWGQREENADRLRHRLAIGNPVVIDADALGFLPDQLPDNCLLTPHAGELARLLGVERDQVEARPLEYAQQAAERHGATVLLKGATQYVVGPDGTALVAVAGPSWTAQAGSGDTLAGICATLLAAGLPALWAGALGASAQAMAAARRPGPWPPEVIAAEVAALLGDLAPGSNATSALTHGNQSGGAR